MNKYIKELMDAGLFINMKICREWSCLEYVDINYTCDSFINVDIGLSTHAYSEIEAAIGEKIRNLEIVAKHNREIEEQGK